MYRFENIFFLGEGDVDVFICLVDNQPKRYRIMWSRPESELAAEEAKSFEVQGDAEAEAILEELRTQPSHGGDKLELICIEHREETRIVKTVSGNPETDKSE